MPLHEHHTHDTPTLVMSKKQAIIPQISFQVAVVIGLLHSYFNNRNWLTRVLVMHDSDSLMYRIGTWYTHHAEQCIFKDDYPYLGSSS